MKKLSFLFLCSLFLISCSANPLTNNHTIIDWVDFVNNNGKHYVSVYSGVISDSEHIGKEVGEVEFKVSDNVNDPGYQPKDGDAAFLEKGTKIFEVKNMPDVIAVKDENEIHGYQLYFSESGEKDFNWHFKEVDIEAINKIEFYKGYNKPQLLNTLLDKQKITELFNLLNEGETNSSFSPNLSQGDPTIYHMVLYNEDPIAYQFQLFFDGDVWYWHPWDTSIVSDEIENFIKMD